jgi:hypothetical protein
VAARSHLEAPADPVESHCPLWSQSRSQLDLERVGLVIQRKRLDNPPQGCRVQIHAQCNPVSGELVDVRVRQCDAFDPSDGYLYVVNLSTHVFRIKAFPVSVFDLVLDDNSFVPQVVAVGQRAVEVVVDGHTGFLLFVDIPTVASRKVREALPISGVYAIPFVGSRLRRRRAERSGALPGHVSWLPSTGIPEPHRTILLQRTPQSRVEVMPGGPLLGFAEKNRWA